MKNGTSIFLLLVGVTCILSCSSRELTKSYNAERVSHVYSLSVGDAAKPQPWEIRSDLISISVDNKDLIWKEINGEPYLLVSSWKEDVKYYKNDASAGFYNTRNYPIWVTVAPELQRLCQEKRFGRKEGLDLRLKQLLGLPPTVEKGYFVEFWVKPQDLFRPCLDGAVDDVNCTLEFPADATDEHRQWINDMRLGSYYSSNWDSNYPWTQLG